MQPESQRTNASTAAGGSESVDETAPHQPFEIAAAASLQDIRLLILKHGDSFAVFDSIGDASPDVGTTQGIYYLDTRHLSRLSMILDGARPMLLSSTLRDDNATLTCDLSNPDRLDASGRLLVQHDVIHIRRSRFLWNASCYERLNIRNFDDQPRRIELGIAFAADFADLFEVRGAHRARRGETHPPKIGTSQTTLSYTGLDNRRLSTTLRFRSRADQALSRRCRLRPRSRPARKSFVCSSKSTATMRDRSSPHTGRFSSPCGMRGAGCGHPPHELRRSRPPTRSLTKPPAAASPISTC